MTTPIARFPFPALRWGIVVLATLTLAPAALGQARDPVGPGEASFEDDVVRGRLTDWEREATPSLVLSAAGNRVLRAFADIAADGSFALALPAIGADTPLGSTICGDPAKEPITVLIDVDLLTTLDGFSTPSEANRGLSVIGMAALTDAAFAADIGAPGTRRVQWFASRAARTVAAGECNNTGAFDIGAGWTPVTVEYGPSGGPHTYRPGIGEGMGWYWWAFPETPAEALPEPARERPAWMVGEWRATQGDVGLVVRLGEDGAGRIELTEAGSEQAYEGLWSVGDGVFWLETEEGPLQLYVEPLDGGGFRMYDEGEEAGGGFVFAPLE